MSRGLHTREGNPGFTPHALAIARHTGLPATSAPPCGRPNRRVRHFLFPGKQNTTFVNPQESDTEVEALTSEVIEDDDLFPALGVSAALAAAEVAEYEFEVIRVSGVDTTTPGKPTLAQVAEMQAAAAGAVEAARAARAAEKAGPAGPAPVWSKKAPVAPAPPPGFVPTPKFLGSQDGLVFKMGSHGACA